MIKNSPQPTFSSGLGGLYVHGILPCGGFHDCIYNAIKNSTPLHSVGLTIHK